MVSITTPADKPRMRQIKRYSWRCEGHGLIVHAITARTAYANWLLGIIYRKPTMDHPLTAQAAALYLLGANK